MGLLTVLAELRKNLLEIKKQHKLKRLGRALRFLLIGFLIGRNSDKTISQLTAKNQSIIVRVSEHFDEMENIGRRIKESANLAKILAHVESELKRVEDGLADANRYVIRGIDLEKKSHEALICIKEAIIQKVSEVGKSVKEIASRDTYLTYVEKNRCVSTIRAIEEDINYCTQNEVLEDEFVREEKKKLTEYHRCVSNYNKEFVERRKKDYSYLWCKGLLSLDEEQQTAIVTDDRYNLVVAAAGSGKTEVLITRIAYLIARKPDGIKPKRILAIAYQRKAKEEIEQRLSDRYGIENVNVKTFHKLGKDILEQAGKKLNRADVLDDNKKHDLIRTYFEKRIANEPAFYKLFMKYVRTIHDVEKEHNLRDKEKVLTYALERSYFSIDGTEVNSIAEKEIMDLLITHKLNEKPIAVMYEPDMEGCPFRPDFYLPEYDIFIEHWGLKANGKVPEQFSQSSNEYKESREFKKKWFAEHNRTLVETHTYEYDERNPDGFIALLKSRLVQELQAKNHISRSIEFVPKTYSEVVDIAWKSHKTPVDDIVNFITIAKTYGSSPESIANRLANEDWTSKQLTFGNLAAEVYSWYETELRNSGRIDFEDMINKAVEELDHDECLYTDVYDQILIDEYQDISWQRLLLVRKLLERNPACKLFCVGDDWQSVMGFAGSDLNYFVKFEDYFEYPAVTEIRTNYRSVKSIVDAGADLIKNNGRCQRQKTALSSRNEIRPIIVFRSPHKKEYEKNYYRQTAEDCLAHIAEYKARGCALEDILILTRYMRSQVGGETRFAPIVQAFIDKARNTDLEIACDTTKTRSKIRLLTVHKCKGLEAKVVFVLNVVKGTYGFPCEIEDPSIFEPARNNYPQQDQREEERRLFYVAMTRAKEDLYIYTWEHAKSEFLDEIEKHTTEVRLSY